ncbi:MAG: hypothetical protein L3J57_02690 [Desulfuromusa sp.]|nr:hypothetical protein [Desulfuromusa sp.]
MGLGNKYLQQQGLFALREGWIKVHDPLVCLATAHPAKFGDTVKQAIGLAPTLPPAFVGLETREKRVITISADREQIKNYISANST